LIGFTARAAWQFLELRQHYEAKGRIEAIRGLIDATREAGRKIEQNPTGGLPAPGPYPHSAGPCVDQGGPVLDILQQDASARY